MTWPPPQPPEPDVPHRPWDPGHPRAPELMQEHERLVYVVVDEMIEEWVGLSLTAWPHADGEGRLRFLDPAGAVDIGTTRRALMRFLRAGVGDAVGPRIGHTFAARTKRGTAAELLGRLRRRAGHGEARVQDLRDLLRDPVDLREQGRLLAKLASYGALLASLPSDLERKWKLEEEQEEEEEE